jgi:hypothetical protein
MDNRYIKLKLDFEEIEETYIPKLSSKYFMIQGYICQKGIWWRYYLDIDDLSGKYYTLYNKDGEFAFSYDLFFGDIYTIELKKVSKIKYIFNCIFRRYKQNI